MIINLMSLDILHNLFWRSLFLIYYILIFPYPIFLGWFMMVASILLDISPVKSVEPSLHTIIQSVIFLSLTLIDAIFSSSLNAVNPIVILKSNYPILSDYLNPILYNYFISFLHHIKSIIQLLWCWIFLL